MSVIIIPRRWAEQPRGPVTLHPNYAYHAAVAVDMRTTEPYNILTQSKILTTGSVSRSPAYLSPSSYASVNEHLNQNCYFTVPLARSLGTSCAFIITNAWVKGAVDPNWAWVSLLYDGSTLRSMFGLRRHDLNYPLYWDSTNSTKYGVNDYPVTASTDYEIGPVLWSKRASSVDIKWGKKSVYGFGVDAHSNAGCNTFRMGYPDNTGCNAHKQDFAILLDRELNLTEMYSVSAAPYGELFIHRKDVLYFLSPSTGTILTFTKASITNSGKTQYSNAKYVPIKTALTNTGKSTYLNQKLTATKAALTLAGKTLLSNANYVASKASLTIAGKYSYLNQKFAVTKAALTLAGKSVYSNAKYAISKASITIAGKDFNILGVGVLIQVTKAALALAGKTVQSNAKYVFSKAALTVTGKDFSYVMGAIIALTKAALTAAGKTFTTKADEAIALTKAALQATGKSFGFAAGLIKKWRMLFEEALRGKVGQLVVSGSTTLANIFGTTPKENAQVTFSAGTGDLSHVMTCSGTEVVGSKYPAFFIESTTDIDYTNELYMSSAEAEVIEETT